MGGSQDTWVPNSAWPGVIQGLGISEPTVSEPSVSACQPVSVALIPRGAMIGYGVLMQGMTSIFLLLPVNQDHRWVTSISWADQDGQKLS